MRRWVHKTGLGTGEWIHIRMQRRKGRIEGRRAEEKRNGSRVRTRRMRRVKNQKNSRRKRRYSKGRITRRRRILRTSMWARLHIATRFISYCSRSVSTNGTIFTEIHLVDESVLECNVVLAATNHQRDNQIIV